MTWSAFTINYLHVGRPQTARASFNRSCEWYLSHIREPRSLTPTASLADQANIRPPFAVWDECRHTQLPNGSFRLDDAYGADHFVTGPGGFLQAITHGLGGVRLEDDAMTLRPSLPENAEGLVLRRFAYRGVRLSLSVDASGIALEAHDSTHKTRLTVVADGSDSPAPLVPGKPLRFDVGAALTMRASSSVRVPTKADDLETAAAGAPTSL